jgi:hypothetical protein
VGNWTLNVVDNAHEEMKGILEKWRLTLWGDTKVIEISGVAAVTATSASVSTASKTIATLTTTTVATTPTVSIPINNSTAVGSIVKHFSSDSGYYPFLSFLIVLFVILYFAWKRGLFNPPKVKIPEEEDFELEMLDQGDLHEGDTGTINDWNDEDFDNLIFDADENV